MPTDLAIFKKKSFIYEWPLVGPVIVKELLDTSDPNLIRVTKVSIGMPEVPITDRQPYFDCDVIKASSSSTALFSLVFNFSLSAQHFKN